MATTGRNAPCPCGSGKKFKKCHGAITPGPTALPEPSADSLRRIQLEMRRHEAREHRRRLMQGLGRPIISFEDHGFRIVAVGNEVRWSKSWITFQDFLLDYIKAVFTPAWGAAELAKPDAQRHPLLDWFTRVGNFFRANAGSKQGTINVAPMNGAVKAYLGLAYDLYLCAHNAELPELLLKRLRNRDQFEGAVYEAYLIGLFAKAGFKIELEDEGDSKDSHCEFTATHLVTGRKFSVEAKAVTSASKRSGPSTESPQIRDKLYEALRKNAKHERIIFIELSRTQTVIANGAPDWAPQVDEEKTIAERELTIGGQPAPPAYLFLTNRPFVHALDERAQPELGVAYGFKIGTFPVGRSGASMLELVDQRERHIELYWLLKAMQAHVEIPSTFDDRLPEETFSTERVAPLHIGETFAVPDDKGGTIPATLVEGTVAENERRAYCVFRTIDGRHFIHTVPLSEEEIGRYHRSPETFFEVVKSVPTVIKHPLDAFDFCYASYAQTPREKLLEFMSSWPEIGAWRDLPQPELAKRYCGRIAEGLWTRQAGRSKLS